MCVCVCVCCVVLCYTAEGSSNTEFQVNLKSNNCRTRTAVGNDKLEKMKKGRKMATTEDGSDREEDGSDRR